ncbi:hypothetical protein Tco_0621874 [Tanacetum coccineum]
MEMIVASFPISEEMIFTTFQISEEMIFANTYTDLFSMKVNHGGSFTSKGGREYVLGSDQDVKELLKYVVRNKVIEQRKETKVEASGNEAEYFDPFDDLNDILGNDDVEHKEEHFEMNDDSDGFVDEQNIIVDVPMDMQPFKDNMRRMMHWL